MGCRSFEAQRQSSLSLRGARVESVGGQRGPDTAGTIRGCASTRRQAMIAVDDVLITVGNHLEKTYFSVRKMFPICTVAVEFSSGSCDVHAQPGLCALIGEKPPQKHAHDVGKHNLGSSSESSK